MAIVCALQQCDLCSQDSTFSIDCAGPECDPSSQDSVISCTYGLYIVCVCLEYNS